VPPEICLVKTNDENHEEKIRKTMKRKTGKLDMPVRFSINSIRRINKSTGVFPG